MKALLLALALLLVAPPILALEDSMPAPKSKTILAGPGTSGPSTIGRLKEILSEKTRIKGFGIRTKLGKGVSVRAGLLQRETGKSRPNNIGGTRGLGPKRGNMPAIAFKIKL